MFPTFKNAIAGLALTDTFSREQLVNEDFLISGDGRFDVYYAPFDYTNAAAKVMLVGVTPGWTQMQASFPEARKAIAEGSEDREVLRRAKTVAAFSGSLRTNLVSMLDGIGLPLALGISSSIDLFSLGGAHLVQSTSMLRYPVFNIGKNYSGSPPVLKNSLLTSQLDPFIQELATVEEALVVPLGKSVGNVVEQLVAEGAVEAERCLLGFPHPSGAFAGRAKQFEANRTELSRGVREWFDI